MSTLQHMGWLFLISCCFYYKLPDGFQKCNRRQAEFSECLTKAVENALRQLNKPIEEYGLYLEPLDVPPFIVEASNKTAQFSQKYTNFRMYGFSVVNCSEIKMDFTTNNLTIDCTFPEITVLVEYNYDGKFLDLMFNGTGAGSFMLENMRVYLSFILGEYEKFGQMHYTVIRHKMELYPEPLTNFNLGNIVSGDIVQSRKVNEALDKNWEILVDELKPGYERAIGNHIATIFNNFLEKVPISEIFD